MIESKKQLLESIEDCNAEIVYYNHQLEECRKSIENNLKRLAFFQQQLKLITDGEGQENKILGQLESENQPSTGTDNEGEISGTQEQLSSSVSVRKLNLEEEFELLEEPVEEDYFNGDPDYPQ